MPAGATSYRLSQRRKLALSAKENESVEDAYERRLKESQKVEERVEVVFSEQEIQQALNEVGIIFMSSSHQAILHITLWPRGLRLAALKYPCHVSPMSFTQKA